jgi:hypothetical protein
MDKGALDSDGNWCLANPYRGEGLDKLAALMRKVSKHDTFG